MKPWSHARNSVKNHGGKPEDYIGVHEFFDSSKATFADVRHRSMLHHSFGIFIAERVFGACPNCGSCSAQRLPYMLNSDGAKVQVRDVGEEHVIEDLARIPSPQDYLIGMPMYHWIGGPVSRVERPRFISMTED